MKLIRWILCASLFMLIFVLVSNSSNVNAKINQSISGDQINLYLPYLSVPPPYEVDPNMFNVAFVYVSGADDGGSSQAHDLGRQYIEQNLIDVHTEYFEFIAEGSDAETVIRNLAQSGFDLIFTTSYGYMDASEVVAGEFPDVDIVHISGDKSNGGNFGNLFGAMETMKYLTGMIAGFRAEADGVNKLGLILTFPIPSELRHANAFALGVQETCADCTIDVRWIFTWHDPILEQEAAQSLFDGGAYIVITGGDTSAPASIAPTGKYGITYNYIGSCLLPRCLTSSYWNWGFAYADIVERSRNGNYVGGDEYFDADIGAMGLFGLMNGQALTPGLASLPAQNIVLVRERLNEALSGEFDRFDVFTGPITDNQGNLVVPAGQSLSQADLVGFEQFGSDCEICMYWLNENIFAELPELALRD